MILLDTHVVVWLTTDSAALGKQSRALYERARKAGELAVSAITFWELAMLIGKGRLGATRRADQHRTMILDAGAQEFPVTGDVAILAADIDLHGDPADRLIAATAIAHGATLMTADRALLRWRHPLQRQDASK